MSEEKPKLSTAEYLLGREAFYCAVCFVRDYAYDKNRISNTLVWQWVNFFQGKVSEKKQGTDYDTFKIDFVTCTPAMIVGFRLWWANRWEFNLPLKCAKVHDYFEEYCASKHFSGALLAGERKLRSLMSLPEHDDDPLDEGERVDPRLIDRAIEAVVGREMADKIFLSPLSDDLAKWEQEHASRPNSGPDLGQ